MLVDALVHAHLVDFGLGSAAVALRAVGNALSGGLDLRLVGRGDLFEHV